MDFTPQVTDLLNKAKQMAINAKEQVSSESKTLSQKIKDGLLAHSATIQGYLDKVFKEHKILSPEEVNALDEQLRQMKQQMLEAEANKTKSKLLAYGIGLVVIAGIIWVLVKYRNKIDAAA